MKTIKDVKRAWIYVCARDYSITETKQAWKAFVRNCKREHKSLDEVYESLMATYEYRKTL